jgi:hypothetical protein
MTTPWYSKPANIVAPTLWMIDERYERREIERMGNAPHLYEREFMQASLEAASAAGVGE